MAERAVQTIKRLWKKSEDFHQSLMIYRATPLESGFSPAELLLGRIIRTTLPQLKEGEKGDFAQKDQHLKNRQKRNFDRRTCAKKLGRLEENDRVWIKTNDKDGMEGVVIREAEEPESYLLEREGRTIRRNRKHITALPLVQEQQEPQELYRDAIEPVELNVAEELETVMATSPVLNQENVKVTRYGRISKPNRRYDGFVK